MQLFLVGMQVMSVGLNFVFWAMLPNTIEYGERATGLHVEVGGMAIFRVADGQIVEQWGIVDMLGMLRQLNAL